MESKFEYYSRLEDEIIRTYREAKDEETRNAARMLMKEHQNKMFEWETLDFYEVYRAYREATEDGNEFLHFENHEREWNKALHIFLHLDEFDTVCLGF